MADLSKGVKLACEDYNRRLYLGKAQVCSSPSRARTRTPSTIIFSTKETASASPKEETEWEKVERSYRNRVCCCPDHVMTREKELHRFEPLREMWFADSSSFNVLRRRAWGLTSTPRRKEGSASLSPTTGGVRDMALPASMCASSSERNRRKQRSVW